MGWDGRKEPAMAFELGLVIISTLLPGKEKDAKQQTHRSLISAARKSPDVSP